MKYLIIALLALVTSGCHTIGKCRNPRHFDCVMGTKQFGFSATVFTWKFPPTR